MGEGQGLWMRRPRLKISSSHAVAYYHCVSRVVNREFVLGDAEKEQFIRFMRLYEKLYGLRVISYCVMSNHFHILVEVPQRPADEDLPDDKGLVAHVQACLGEGKATELAWELEHFRSQKNHEAAEALRQRWFSRMWDISRYMKVLKQRFTQWFNGRHNRRGTLWEDRFKSVLVEGAGQALKTMSAYIDLNPVRANICDDPKDYRWCSYAEAVAGGKRAREGYRFLDSFEVTSDGSTVEGAKGKGVGDFLRRYRCYLFGIPESQAVREEELAREEGGGEARVYRARIPREKALEVLKEGGKLKRSDYLRCRVRYFCDGAAIGSKGFIEQVFRESKDRFHEARATGARSLQGLETVSKPERLYNLRQLRKDVVC